MADFSAGAVPENAGGGYRQDNVVRLQVPEKSPPPSKPVEIVSFNRRELDQILQVYAIKVAEGEWRDYAIDMLRDRAVFSVFKRTADVPMFRIEKNPRLARRQGAWCVVNATGQILKRGHELALVLKLFERKPGLSSV